MSREDDEAGDVTMLKQLSEARARLATARKALEDIGHWQERLTDRTAAHFKSIALAGLAALDATPAPSHPLGLTGRAGEAT